MENNLLTMTSRIEGNNTISEVRTNGDIRQVVQGASLAISELIRMLARDSKGKQTESDIISEIHRQVVKDIYDNVR